MTGFERRADHLIRTARARSGNTDFSENSGVPQRAFVQFLNDAQERIYNKILQSHCSLFQKQAFLSTQQNVAAVDLPTDDIYLDHNIVSVLFAYNGNPINYAPLQLRSVRQEISVMGYPNSYFLLGNQIVLSPIPSNTVSNALKITYQKVIPELDIRRAQISSASTTTLVIDINDSIFITESQDDIEGGWVDYACVVDAVGTQVATGITMTPAFSAGSSTATITCSMSSSQASAINTAVASGSCYLVFGKNATTHCQLPRVCERYLTEYSVLRAQMRDSNVEAKDTSPLLQAIEQEILDAVEDLEEDISAIPILDYSMINYADEI